MHEFLPFSNNFKVLLLCTSDSRICQPFRTSHFHFPITVQSVISQVLLQWPKQMPVWPGERQDYWMTNQDLPTKMMKQVLCVLLGATVSCWRTTSCNRSLVWATEAMLCRLPIPQQYGNGNQSSRNAANARDQFLLPQNFYSGVKVGQMHRCALGLCCKIKILQCNKCTTVNTVMTAHSFHDKGNLTSWTSLVLQSGKFKVTTSNSSIN